MVEQNLIELNSDAEKFALKATKLLAFRKVALGGIKEQVAEMLNLIGRVKEIFATYTKHDISHINAMLRHLNWLIPPETQKEMTPADWLLITMAIFFHDLGMLVTLEEFEKRNENEAFQSFLKRLETDPKSKDYLNRAKKMTELEREKFFFQEFIRENHPARIKEWITGRYSWHWGDAAKPITETISKLMEPFPARFRENLSLVCESHHRDNLNRLDLYPLCQPYGNENAEIANVQYAALILRIVDLIHVTKDRTPSVMYKTIKFSDPKGVEEWDKQRDTFAVRHAGRQYDPDDQNTHVIMVSADFTEERPFFALTEYLAWADAEIKQTKRWSDQSRENKDGANFFFPWQGIRGDLRVEGNQPQQMRFEFDRSRLLDLLVGHAIYNDATVAIRELLQNGIDAVRFQHHLDTAEGEAAGQVMGTVSVIWNKDTRSLVIEDNGTGMDLDIIKFHLMRVGSSFYDSPQFAVEHKSFTPISRFGIGILTCFMISDDIEIVTIKGACGHRIRMSSVHADYLLRELPLGEPKLVGIEPHGTRVTLILREGVDLSKSIEDILRYWIILPECRVEYREAGKPSVKIGFDSPSKALEDYYEKSRNEQQDTWSGIEVICKHREVGGGRYEMAIAVKSGLLPEKTFAQPPRTGLPAVCIEGIRVSDDLPGFQHNDREQRENAVFALVSVRGVRGLRTTVSRSGLEQDEEYVKLGLICAEMLVDHIREEIGRISEGKKPPLSRASTAGKWLSSDLMRAVFSRTVKDRLVDLRKKLPLIVMEKSEKQNGKPVVERSLVSPETLEKESHFWTIESRLVDSLGIISRDLGRELSLNEFLISLAPEHMELGFSPILPDANLFADDIFASHRPTLVQFSRFYQQTAIKWTTGKIARREIVENAIKDEAFFAAFQLEVWKMEPQIMYEYEMDLGSLSTSVAVAEIKGDEPNIVIVETKMATVIQMGSEIAKLWNLIENGLMTSLQRREVCGVLIFDQLSGLYEHLLAKRGFVLRSRDEFDSDRVWGEPARKANTFLEKYGIKGNIPESLDFLIGENIIFNATDYWRDWHRIENK